ncbi:MAG: NADPH-dependent FMN reductase [Phycisphaerales bacterium]
MPQPRILTFAGSGRKNSWNRALAEAAATMAEANGAKVTRLNLKELNLPIFDEDVEAEQGHSESVLKLKRLMKEHDGFLISCPEYNSSITPLLKNAIDWASRPRDDEKPLECFKGKAIGLLAASPGALGGLRGLVTVRSIFGNIGAFVCPTQFALASAHEAFNDDGTLKNDKQRAAVQGVVNELINLTNALNATRN